MVAGVAGAPGCTATMISFEVAGELIKQVARLEVSITDILSSSASAVVV